MLPAHLDWLYHAFNALSHFRPVTLGYNVAVYGPIPLTAMDVLARRLQVDDEGWDHFFQCILEADRVHLKRVNRPPATSKDRKTQKTTDDGAGDEDDGT